jgi:hypothetical protein
MGTNTSYEDAGNPTHTIGPITGEQPGRPNSTHEKTSADSTRIEVHHEEKEAEAKNTRKTGSWAAGTGKLFDPDRWLREDGSFDPNAGPSLPFSLGQRGCFGKNLAVCPAPATFQMMVRGDIG